MKKFELTAEFVTNVFGKKLFRIKALVAFGNVEKGELGGYAKEYLAIADLMELHFSDECGGEQ